MKIAERLVLQMSTNDAVVAEAQTASQKQQRGDEPINLGKPLSNIHRVFRRTSALLQLSREFGQALRFCDSEKESPCLTGVHQ